MTLTIGKIAKLANIGIETIRFYEREKLLPSPERDPSSGYRLYTEQVLGQLRFIASSKGLGFTLKETRELLSIQNQERTSCQTMHTRTVEKLESVQSKIEDLQRLEKMLIELTKACPNSEDLLDKCPIFSSLESK